MVASPGAVPAVVASGAPVQFDAQAASAVVGSLDQLMDIVPKLQQLGQRLRGPPRRFLLVLAQLGFFLLPLILQAIDVLLHLLGRLVDFGVAQLARFLAQRSFERAGVVLGMCVNAEDGVVLDFERILAVKHVDPVPLKLAQPLRIVERDRHLSEERA